MFAAIVLSRFNKSKLFQKKQPEITFREPWPLTLKSFEALRISPNTQPCVSNHNALSIGIYLGIAKSYNRFLESG